MKFAKTWLSAPVLKRSLSELVEIVACLDDEALGRETMAITLRLTPSVPPFIFPVDVRVHSPTTITMHLA